jgi:2-keto-3-deoxy-L-rhamnonate aldolase RhmA
MKNFVKAKLKAGKPSIGTWVGIGHPDVSERLASLGFDWLVFDMEHAPLSVERVQIMMQSMSYAKSCIPMVRLRWNDPVLIKRVLDIGAYGIVIPWVNTRQDAINAVQACRYPPEGIRGFGPRRAALLDPDYIKTANREILIAVQIETETALKNLDEILSVKGVDVCYIGPWDLSINLGLEVPPSWNHPKLKNTFSRVLEACKRWNVTPGMHCTVDNINDAIAQGFLFCALDDDDTFLIEGAKDRLNKVKGWTPGVS